MLVYTREKLVSHLMGISTLVNLYQNRDPLFTERVVVWLNEVEKCLVQIRSPLAGMAATERAKILATADGYREQYLEEGISRSRRLSQATAALALDRIQDELRNVVREIDSRMNEWRERLSQFIAVAISKKPIPLPPTEPRNAWLSSVWASWNNNGDTQNMYNYLNAAMTRSDKLFLLDEIIRNITDE